MRRKDREVSGRDQIKAIIKACKVCRIAMIAAGKPYVVPMCFGYEWDDNGLTLWFHSGLKGKKLDAMRENSAICFEMDVEDGVISGGDVACKHSYAFSSVIGEGNMRFAQNAEEKRHGLNCIMQHLTGREGWTYPDPQLMVTEVFYVHADCVEASQNPKR